MNTLVVQTPGRGLPPALTRSGVGTDAPV